HLYQIWLLPERPGLRPSYEQRSFDEREKQGRFRLVAAPDGKDGALTIRQDARLYLASLAPGQEVAHAIDRGRAAWLQVLRGAVGGPGQVEGRALAGGVGVAAREKKPGRVRAATSPEVLLFDLG